MTTFLYERFEFVQGMVGIAAQVKIDQRDNIGSSSI
jgi:hypothetical protein